MGGKGDNNKGNAEKGTPRQYKGSYKAALKREVGR